MHNVFLKLLNMMCVYILCMLYFDFGLYVLEMKVFVFYCSGQQPFSTVRFGGLRF